MDPQHTTPEPWWRVRPGVLILGLLLVTDLFFIIGSVAFDLGLMADERLSLGVDRGLPETWGYVQYVWSGLALCVLLWRRRDALYVALGMMVAYFIVDDASELHESVGSVLRDSDRLGSVFGVDPQHVGELLFSVTAAILLLGLVALTWPFAARATRRVAVGVLGCAAAMAFAGIVVDFIQPLIDAGNPFLVLLEDGGELVAGSVLAAFLLTTAVVGDDTDLHWRPLRRGPTPPVSVQRRDSVST